jgi:hypothetical protein
MMGVSERRELFEAMIREDDGEARAELRCQYVKALRGEGGPAKRRRYVGSRCWFTGERRDPDSS